MLVPKAHTHIAFMNEQEQHNNITQEHNFTKMMIIKLSTHN